MWRYILFDSITGSIRNAVNKIRHQDDVAALTKATTELKKALLSLVSSPIQQYQTDRKMSHIWPPVKYDHSHVAITDSPLNHFPAIYSQKTRQWVIPYWYRETGTEIAQYQEVNKGTVIVVWRLLADTLVTVSWEIREGSQLCSTWKKYCGNH